MSSGQALLAQHDDALVPSLRGAAQIARDAGTEAGQWLVPIVRSGKRGAISAHLTPILDRLLLDLDAWMELMRGAGSFLGGAFGHLAARAHEALQPWSTLDLSEKIWEIPGSMAAPGHALQKPAKPAI